MVPCRREGGGQERKAAAAPRPPCPRGRWHRADGQGSLWAPLQEKQGTGKEWGGPPSSPSVPPLLTPTLGGRMRLPTEAFSCSVAAEVAALPTRSGAWMGLIRM